MKFFEPVFRPRFLLWACIVIGAMLAWTSTAAVTDLKERILHTAPLIIVLPCVLVLWSMFAHFVGQWSMHTEIAGMLSCRFLLPTNEEARAIANRFTKSSNDMLLGMHPLTALISIVWFAPNPISWQEQWDLTRRLVLRPLPAILVGCVLLICMLVLTVCEFVFMWRVGSQHSSENNVHPH